MSSPGEKEEEGALFVRTLIGVGLALFGMTVDNVGVTLQKLSHRKQVADSAQPHEDLRTSYCSDCKWILGLALYLGGNVVNAVGLSFGPQSLFAALGSMTLVINVM